MRVERKFKRYGDWWKTSRSALFANRGLVVCASTLGVYFEIPTKVPYIVLVISDEPHKEAYRVKYSGYYMMVYGDPEDGTPIQEVVVDPQLTRLIGTNWRYIGIEIPS